MGIHYLKYFFCQFHKSKNTDSILTNFLIGSSPQHVNRDSDYFIEKNIGSLNVGIPSQLLTNSRDIRRAEYELQAAKLDTKVARANF